MLYNYFKIALRQFYRLPVFSFINLAGLTLGLAVTLLIGLWVYDELSWDGTQHDRNRLYRVYLNYQGDQGVETSMAVCLPLWGELRDNYPEVEHITPTNWGWDVQIAYGDKKIQKFAYFATGDFFKMFSYPIIEGSEDGQLTDPSTMIVTMSTARALFGDEDALGKTVRVGKSDLVITGVVADPPDNSSFRFACLLPFSQYIQSDPWVKGNLTNWDNNSFNLYVELKVGVDENAFESRVKNVINTHNQPDVPQNYVTLLPMTRWHLYDSWENGRSQAGRLNYVMIVAAIGIFILFIACINFMNLSTARSAMRAKEVGIRKSVGSRRSGLVTQFLGETFLLAALAMLLAIFVVQLVLPAFNSLVVKNLALDFLNPLTWMAILGVVLVTAILSGAYPAFYLWSSHFAAHCHYRFIPGLARVAC